MTKETIKNYIKTMSKINNLLKKVIKKFSPEDPLTITKEYRECLDLLENTKNNIFITGKAGTGKTTLIQYLKNHSKKKIVVLAPTGIAALNSHGQTIHSFFGFPPRMIRLDAIRKQGTSRIFTSLDCLVIDEISMVRADLLDGIDKFLRANGRDQSLPFGGVQMIFVGDLYQLPPVLTNEEYDLYHQLYDSPYFFHAHSFRLDDFVLVELKTIFRQKEIQFIDFLNKVRNGQATSETFDLINEKVIQKPLTATHLVLCTTNKTAESINQEMLAKINKPLFSYLAATEGIFPTEDRNLPVDLELKLKEKARVLFVKNDQGKRWVNGTLGTVYKLTQDLIQVKLDNSAKIVEVNKEEWDQIKYEYDEKSGGVNEKVIGKLIQYPLRLAWAITIHKSQGMSFDKVCLDFSRSPFAHGQTYVALSRCRSLEGIILTKKIWPNDVLIDERVIDFYKKLR